MFNLKDESVWRHLIGLSAAAKMFQIDMKVYLDASQPCLDIAKLYSLYIASKFGITISLSKIDNAKDVITRDMEVRALELMGVELFDQMKECFKEVGVEPHKLVVPYETSVFSYADFY